MLNSASNISKFVLDVLEITFVGVAVFALTYLFIGQPLEISGNSMHPTLMQGEQIVAEKLSGKISRGDIIVFSHPENPETLIIKRVIALPGEIFKITSGKVFINGGEIQEKYVSTETVGKNFLSSDNEYQVPIDKFVVLGDNRAESIDSRDWGYIDKNKIVGKSLVVYYPITKMRISDSNIGVEGLTQSIIKFVGKIFS